MYLSVLGQLTNSISSHRLPPYLLTATVLRFGQWSTCRTWLLCLLSKYVVGLIKVAIYCDQIKPTQVLCFPGLQRIMDSQTNVTGKLKFSNNCDWITDSRVSWSIDINTVTEIMCRKVTSQGKSTQIWKVLLFI